VDKDDYSGAIRKSGLKRTKSRSAILEVLEHSPQPLSAEAVYAELKNKDINLTCQQSTEHLKY
jgi:Fe2+ or Zn2+ uptake regulation protein